ncbi:cytochrome P450 [Dichomitus squalens]|uniref:Cytochrome P450 n=2 Tax=Dichomitus squalens TaxID=114155 RepID=A0A4Q9NDQ7_9APHY|nr:cytochrome P450 [Dichomitus squalens LYAD-421 SS1]EJF59821.1 cytochrome P450 [Dichomitus squalens LYAD-421 SS1]TBU38535.1 cytochrome P450 [Dichomitus squalens]TBU57526.1 cytochrome P450 [Dichomitus squalens]
MLVSLLQGIVICSVTWFLWKYFRQVFVKSPLDNVPGPAAESFIYGNLRQILDRNGWDFIKSLESYDGVAKLHGPLGHRMLFVFDPTALHSVIVKDQYIYEEAAFFISSNLLNFGPGLLSTLGDHHRKQRKLLNPVFSIAHMRRMIPIFNDVGLRLQKAIESRVSPQGDPVELDMLTWMGRTALELIGQAGLGYSFDPLVTDKPDDFAIAVKNFSPAALETTLLRRLLPYVSEFGSPAFRRWVVERFPHKGVQKLKSVVDVMNYRSIEIYRSKKQALEQGDEAVARQVGEGKDLMSILLRANMAASVEDRLPEEEIVGQIATFIFAGMDTTSNALAVTLSLLAQHPEVQEKLRNEILEAHKGDVFDYDMLVSLPYLDAVCRESLRVHAPVSNLFRETRQDVVLPLSKPIRGVDGTMIHEIFVPKDTVVAIGLLASNRSKAIWGEDAEEWKPERWLSPLPESVAEAKVPGIYSNLMTFLGGGRACIGFKFSQLEMKVILCLLLSKFTFTPSDKKIHWNLSGVRFPTVDGSPKPSMPMNVALYKGSVHA